MKRVFMVKHENPRWPEVVTSCGRAIREWVAAGREVVVTLAEPKRSSDANAAMWAKLHDLSEQVGWKRARWRGDRCIEDGRYVLLVDEPDAARLSDEDYKDVLTAALKRPRLFGSIDGGGIVAVGMRTSRMSSGEMRDLLTLIDEFGARLGVEWGEPEALRRAA